MITKTIHGKLLAKEEDLMNYQTLVFKNLDKASFGETYYMLTVCPNWESYIPEIGEIGYVTYNEVIAGVDKWYSPDTGQMIPYNYTNIYFIKFVRKVDSSKKDIIL